MKTTMKLIAFLLMTVVGILVIQTNTFAAVLAWVAAALTIAPWKERE